MQGYTTTPPGSSGYSGYSGAAASGTASPQAALALLSTQAGPYDGAFYGGFAVTRKLIVDPETTGGNYWTTKANDITRTTPSGFSLNGFGYCAAGIAQPGSITLSTMTSYNNGANTWTSAANLNVARYWANAGLSVGGFSYVALGYNAGGQTLSTVECFSDAANSWTIKNPFPYFAGIDAFNFTLNGYAYVDGGRSGSSAYSSNAKYNQGNDTWTLMTPIPPTSFGRNGMGASSLNSYGYLIGGLNRATGLSFSNVDQFNDALNTWAAKAVLPLLNQYNTGVSVCGFMYSVCGGNINTGDTFSSTLQYNDLANIWITRMPNFTLMAHSSFVATGFAYAVGGQYSTSTYSYTTQYQAHNMYELTTSFRKSRNTPTQIAVAAALDGYPTTVPIWLQTNGSTWNYIEANTDSVLKYGQTLSTTYAAPASGIRDYRIKIGIPRYVNFGAGYWAGKQPSPVTTYYATAFELGGYGYVGPGNGPGTALYKYTNETDSWTAYATEGNIRAGSAGSSLGGFGYATGGHNGSVYLSTASKYNDATNLWSSIINCTTTYHYLCGAFSLHGMEYVVGGNNGSTYISNCDMYMDASNFWATRGYVYTEYTSGISVEGSGWIVQSYTTSIDASTKRYSPATDVWDTVTGQLTARYAGAAMTLDGYGYSGPGYVSGGTANFERFDAAAALWCYRTPFPYANYAEAQGFAINGFGYFAHGYLNGVGGTSTMYQYVRNCDPVLAVSLYVKE